jgi:exonuclease III
MDVLLSFLIMTWNVLTTKYASEHIGSIPYPTEEARVADIITKVMKCMEEGKIICLQEVWGDLSSELDKEASKKGYTCKYKGWQSGKAEMGVMILIPKRFSVLKYREIKFEKGKNENHFQIAILADKKTGNNFIVVNTHVPCKWDNPTAMIGYHCTLVKTAVVASQGEIPDKAQTLKPELETAKKTDQLTLSPKIPIIWCGDFNWTPKEMKNNYPVMFWNFIQTILIGDSETVTSRTQKKGEGEDENENPVLKDVFEGRLDWAMVLNPSSGYTLINTSHVEEAPKECLLPSKGHPSDHLPVYVECFWVKGEE